MNVKKSKSALNALRKKIQGQLDTLPQAKTLIEHLVQTGLNKISQENFRPYLQQIEVLKAAHLIGLSEHFLVLFQLLKEQQFLSATETLLKISTIIKMAEEHLAQKLTDPDLRPDTQSPLESHIGYIWKREELIQYGNVLHDVELVEFVFYRHEDLALNTTFEEGFCLETQSGKIYSTQIIRPAKAKSSIPESDSTLESFVVKDLAIYPGSINPRVRWESAESKPLTQQHYAAFKRHARQDFESVIKEVKNEIKRPLGQKNPVFILQVATVGEQDGHLVIQNAQGDSIRLENISYFIKLFSKNKKDVHDSLWGLRNFPPNLLQNIAMAVMFEANLETRTLVAKPLAIINDERLLRLVF